MIKSSSKRILFSATFLGALGVILGALARHSLSTKISPESLISFETGVRYQMYHALLLLFIGSTPLLSYRSKLRLFWVFLIGILFFSGSIYFLVLEPILGFSIRKLGWLTPIGGMLLIIGWIWLGIHLIQRNK